MDLIFLFYLLVVSIAIFFSSYQGSVLFYVCFNNIYTHVYLLSTVFYTIKRRLKQYQIAINCYDTAIELFPKYSDACNNKGIALYELKQYQDAIKCYDKAIELDPKNKLFIDNLKIVLEKIKK